MTRIATYADFKQGVLVSEVLEGVFGQVGPLFDMFDVPDNEKKRITKKIGQNIAALSPVYVNDAAETYKILTELRFTATKFQFHCHTALQKTNTALPELHHMTELFIKKIEQGSEQLFHAHFYDHDEWLDYVAGSHYQKHSLHSKWPNAEHEPKQQMHYTKHNEAPYPWTKLRSDTTTENETMQHVVEQRLNEMEEHFQSELKKQHDTITTLKKQVDHLQKNDRTETYMRAKQDHTNTLASTLGIEAAYDTDVKKLDGLLKDYVVEGEDSRDMVRSIRGR